MESIADKEHTPQVDSELAKAYIAAADIGERKSYERALELLKPYEEVLGEDHCWNYRLASAYYYLDEEGPALHYFEKALKCRPGDEDTQGYVDDCRRRLAFPYFSKNFRERTKEAWEAFIQIEEELRQLMDADKLHQFGEEILRKCADALKIALCDTSFELGYSEEKYELILSPDGFRYNLFPLVYFKQQAPEAVLEHWNIHVGRKPNEEFELRAGDITIHAEDVQMWVEKTENKQLSLKLYCEKLLPILKEDADRVWWALSMLVDQTIGEVSAIALISNLDIYTEPKTEASMLLSKLPELVKSMGLTLWNDGEEYLENSFLTYELEPVKDTEADWRMDVYTGYTNLPALINEYMSAKSSTIDEYYRAGIVAGFLCYPVDRFTGDNRAEQILQFRDTLQEEIHKRAGVDSAVFLGGATGLYYGYLDFIAWDLPAVLDAARDFFAEHNVDYGAFHVFRRDVGAVRLWEREAEPEIHPETGSLLSTEDIEALSYAEKGICEEPDYPWIWLQAGKLRSHFGDNTGALEAVNHGLLLEPGDYEFLTLKKEIEQGATLEQMEYHWINPDADQTLQQGLDENAENKQNSISCITVNEEGLKDFWSIFGSKPKQYLPDAPYTQFPYKTDDRSVNLIFKMNEAGMSKLNTKWLWQLKSWIKRGQWMERSHPDGRKAYLDTVLIEIDYRIGLLYKLLEDDVYFQIFLNSDGTEQEGAFWSSEEISKTELYTEEDFGNNGDGSA